MKFLTASGNCAAYMKRIVRLYVPENNLAGDSNSHLRLAAAEAEAVSEIAAAAEEVALHHIYSCQNTIQRQ
jgi:hypothetical protein